MKLLNVSALIVALASLAGAENQPRMGDLEISPVKAVVKGVTFAASDHALVKKNEVVLLQGQRRLVIPVKSITAVSYTAANILYMSVSPSPLTQVPSPSQLVKTKDRYVGIVWKDKSQTKGVVVKVRIGEYWGFMNGLEAAGIKAVNADALSIAR